MRNFVLGFALSAATLIAGMVVAQTEAQPTMTMLNSSKLMQNMGRPCLHPTGGWTEVDCSAAAAYSAALNTWSRYVIQAVAGDPYFAVATAGSGQDADSNDGYIPEGAWYEIVTPGDAAYLTCDGSADSSTIRYYECL